MNLQLLFSLLENVDNDSFGMIIISNASLFLYFRFGKRKTEIATHHILQIKDTSIIHCDNIFSYCRLLLIKIIYNYQK